MGRRALVSRAAAVAVAAGIGVLAGCGAGTYRLDRGIDRLGLSAADTRRHGALVAEGDRLWAQRADPTRLALALARWEAAVDMKDDDWQTYARLARGYFFQADAVFAFQASGGAYPYHGGSSVDPAARARHREALRRGSRAALRGMAARSREFEMRLSAGIDMDRAVRVFGKDSAALVYWYVANLGAWARTSGVRALLRSRGTILGCVQHLRRIDPGYFYGGADRLLGVYHAAAPRLMGGDLDRSRAHFEAALRAGAAYFGNALLAAEFLDRKAEDRASFEARLRQILRTPPIDAPDLGPENEVERRKARALLGRASYYFSP
jgi:hypothetical protein